jgi:hypothetical protein
LKGDDVPDDAIQPILSYANEKMALDITALTQALIEEFGDRLPDAERGTELRLEITHSLNALANRIDEGYSIEIRAGEIPPGDEGEPPEGVTEETAQTAEVIAERQPRMRFLNLTGTRILELPEAYPDEDGDPAE